MTREFLIPTGKSAAKSIDYLIGILKDARMTTIRSIADCSKEQLHYQHAAGWNTIGALLSHIIACDAYFRIYFIENRKFTTEEEQRFMPGLDLGENVPQLITDDPLSVYLEELDDSHKRMLTAVAGLSEAKLWERREEYSEDGCNLAWVLYHKAEDEVHHRGQITLLNKLFAQQAV